MSTEITAIHVRFNSDGTVMTIGERPQKLSAQQWFNLLSHEAASCYEALSGGRGLFKLPTARMEALKTAGIAAVESGKEIFRPTYENGALKSYAGLPTA